MTEPYYLVNVPQRMAAALAAITLFIFTGSGLAAAQSSDVLGTYPLGASSSGTVCPPETSATLEVTAVTDTSITMVLNGTSGTLSFDPSTQQFSGNYPGATLTGGFSGDTVTMTLNYASGTCISTLTGSRSGSGSGGVPVGVLVGGGLVLVLVAGGVRVRKRRAALKPAPGVAAGLAGKFAAGTPVVDPAVSADRMGGFEDSSSYGEGAGVASPAASKAYEALVVAQAPRSAEGAPFITPSGEIIVPVKPFWTQRGLIDLYTGALLDPTTGKPFPQSRRRVIGR